jgi:DNA segregation ATPase FtsK/SpoIIIE, S-DNA-T family
MTGPIHSLLWLVAFLGGGGLLLVIVLPRVPMAFAWLRAGKGFKRYATMAAWRAKRGWRSLALALGLYYATEDRKDLQGRTVKGQKRYPLLKVHAAPYGVVARLATIPKVGLTEVEKAAQHIADAWGCETVEVRQLNPKWLELKGLMRDPLSELVEPHYLMDDWYVILGRDPWGETIRVPLRELSGFKVAGMPGYGKTMLILGWVARLCQSPLFQVITFDGKVRDPQYGSWAALRDRAVLQVGDDPQEANEALKKIADFIKTRPAALVQERGTHKFWKNGPSLINPLVFVVIDECHNYIDTTGLTGPRKALVEENKRLCQTITKEGRELGVIGVFGTQKQTGDAIPTAVRDNLEVGISFAVATLDAAEAALGSGIRKDEPNDPTQLIDKERYVGVAVAGGVPGRRGYTRFRTEQHDDDELERLIAATAPDRRDIFAPSLHLVTDARPDAASA